MIRGSTPTFCFELPSDASDYAVIEVVFVQNDIVKLTVNRNSLSQNGKEIFFEMTEADSLAFDDGAYAEVQIKLVSYDGEVILSEIKKFAVRKNLSALR